MSEHCTIPPKGWTCTRDVGHTGPCAANPTLTLKNGTVVPLYDWEGFYHPPTPALKKLMTTPSVLEHWRWGLIFRLGSFWVGVHYSKQHRRWCVNPVPCVTFWASAPGGDVPAGPDFHPLTFSS